MTAGLEPEAPTVVYVASARGNEIAAFVLHTDDGHLEQVQRLAVHGSVTPLAVTPDRQVLYAALRAEEASVATFSIDGLTGELRPLANTRVTDPPIYLATDARGKFLLSASYVAASLSIYAIRGDGSIEPTPIQQTKTPPHAHCIRSDPTNRFLFVTSLGGDVILQFVFDPAKGRATPNAVPFVAAPMGSGPRHMAFHPSDSLLYVNGELDGTICSYAFNSETGRLHALHCAAMLEEPGAIVPWAADIGVTPDGRYLYASERRSSTLTIFELGKERGLLVRHAIVTTEEQPRSFAIDPRGRFLIVAGEKSNSLSVYTIDPSTGGLEQRYRYPVSEKPTWVTIVDLRASPPVH